MNFQDALTELQAGKRLTRTCWKDRSRYVTLFKRPENYPGYKTDNTFYIREAMTVGHYTHMDVVWNVSGVLATDWEIVE